MKVPVMESMDMKALSMMQVSSSPILSTVSSPGRREKREVSSCARKVRLPWPLNLPLSGSSLPWYWYRTRYSPAEHAEYLEVVKIFETCEKYLLCPHL